MNAFERRTQIIDCMKMRKFDTASSLASEFEVSKSTIFRDVQELSVNGYPIQADMGYGGGIVWTGDRRQFPISERELIALHNAIAVVSPEDRVVLEKMIFDRSKPIVKTTNNDVFELLKNGKSQRELAEKLGISESLLSMVLSRKRKPSAELAKRIELYKLELADNEN